MRTSLARVLAGLGRPVPLRQLIEELQWPDLEAGCSLLDLKRAAERHGVYCVGVSTRDISAALRAVPFAIAQMSPPRPGGLGHFVVIELDSRGCAAISADGGGPDGAADPAKLADMVLLVSARPINLDGPRRWADLSMLRLAPIGAAVFLTFACWWVVRPARVHPLGGGIKKGGRNDVP
jgi:hypothetical protein